MLFTDLCGADATTINNELSNLLDFSVKENKAFIKDFAERVAQARAYKEKARKVAAQTNYKNKELGGGARGQKAVRGDLGKYLVAGRKICYCQTT